MMKSILVLGCSLSFALAACGDLDSQPGEIDPASGGKADQLTQCKPVCDAIGTRSEGWYNSCTNELIGWANCAGCTAECEKMGSFSEGWYSEGTAANCATAGMTDMNNLIKWEMCGGKDPKACQQHSDCVAMDVGCCGCAMGGKTDAFNKDFAATMQKPEICENVMCLAVYMCMGTVPACVQGKCQMVDKKPCDLSGWATCALYCEYGFKTDEDGCSICACNEPPQLCPPVMCELYCEHGFKTGADGCEICSCAQAPQQ